MMGLGWELGDWDSDFMYYHASLHYRLICGTNMDNYRVFTAECRIHKA